MDSSGESADAYIPGLSKKGNRRPRVRCKKTSEIKAKIPVKQPQVETYTPKSKQQSYTSSDDTMESRINKENKQRGKVSLKDLCAEDKKRVANLIKELARVGDEKEKYLGQLKNERENYEQQVMQLVQQQEQILKEREEVQQRLFQCHELLSKYQDQILEKEKKLNESLLEQQISPRLNQQPFYAERDGHHSPLSQRSLSPASYQGRLPSEIQTQRRLSREEIKSKVDRPVTSMIDKEIALHRSYDGPSTILPDHSNYQREPLKPSLPRNFREPIMSSTQKSVDINPYVVDSQDLIPLVPDMSPRSSGQGSRSQTPRAAKTDFQGKSNKVGFKDKLESDENLQYSPNLQQSQIGDREYMKYYKRLRPSDRKRELLKQREKLLEEQNRLQQILRDQEEQLKERQRQLIEKRKMQHERINSLEENMDLGNQDDGSVFNGRVGRLDFDKPLSEVDVDDIPDEAADMVQGRNSRHSIATSPIPKSPPTAEKGTSISRMECSVQANLPTTPPRADVGTSISRFEINNQADDIIYTPPRNDVGTSISRVLQPSQSDLLTTPTKKDVDRFIDKMTEVTANLSAMSQSSPGANRQGNLPLPSNRGRSNMLSTGKAPGDKTLSVVDIVNSLDEDFCNPQLTGSYRSPVQKSSNKVKNLDPKLAPHKYREPVQTRTHGSLKKQNTYEDESTIEEQEESHILEDIFFLK